MASLVKIFCVTKNETDLIEDWIEYHGSLVGLENLVVIDNMSSCEKVLAVYSKYRKQGVLVEQAMSFAGSGQGDAFTAYMRKHNSSCKFLIGVDADEFVHFPDFAEGDRQADIKKRLRRYLLSLPEACTKFSIGTYFEAVPDPASKAYVDQKVDKPVRNICTFTRRQARPCKYFFRSHAFLSTVNGCHNGRVSQGKALASSVCLVHYHATGARRSVERARAIISGYGYANVNAPLHAQLLQLAQVSSPFGAHRVLEYGLFLSKVLVLRDLAAGGLWPESPRVLLDKALKFHTINGAAVDHAHCCKLPNDWERAFDCMVLHDGPVGEAIHTKPLVPIKLPTKPPITPPVTPPTRVALMLSGHFRNFSKRRRFWIDFVAEYAKRGVDIFVHTWSESGERSATGWIDIGHGEVDVEDIQQTIKPTAFEVEDHADKVQNFSLQQEGLDLFYVEFAGLTKSDDFSKHVLSQLYSVHRAFKLVESHQKSQNIKYDILVRMRADSIVENFSRLFTSSLDFAREDVLVANGSLAHQHPGGGRGCGACDQEFKCVRRQRVHAEHTNDICDVFYWGRFGAMQRACEMFLHARQLVKSFKFSNAKAVAELEAKNCLVHHANVTGVKHAMIYEKKIKCFYPERLLREHMVSHFVISDPLCIAPKILY